MSFLRLVKVEKYFSVMCLRLTVDNLFLGRFHNGCYQFSLYLWFGDKNIVPKHLRDTNKIIAAESLSSS